MNGGKNCVEEDIMSFMALLTSIVTLRPSLSGNFSSIWENTAWKRVLNNCLAKVLSHCNKWANKYIKECYRYEAIPFVISSLKHAISVIFSTFLLMYGFLWFLFCVFLFSCLETRVNLGNNCPPQKLNSLLIFAKTSLTCDCSFKRNTG